MKPLQMLICHFPSFCRLLFFRHFLFFFACHPGGRSGRRRVPLHNNVNENYSILFRKYHQISMHLLSTRSAIWVSFLTWFIEIFKQNQRLTSCVESLVHTRFDHFDRSRSDKVSLNNLFPLQRKRVLSFSSIKIIFLNTKYVQLITLNCNTIIFLPKITQ